MTEEELIRTASHLGDQVVRDLDGEGLAQRVLAQLAAKPVTASPVRWMRRGWLIGLAAAAAVLLVLRLTLPGSSSSNGSTTPPASTSTLTVLHELDGLNSGELESVLESLEPAAGAITHPEGGSLDELDTKSLERLLRSLEG